MFAFRGTRLNKTGNLRADLHLLRDLNAEMVVTQRASKKIQNHIRRLQEQHQSVTWSFYTTGRAHPGAIIFLHSCTCHTHAVMALKISTAASPVCSVSHCLLDHDANSRNDTCLLITTILTLQMKICGHMLRHMLSSCKTVALSRIWW